MLLAAAIGTKDFLLDTEGVTLARRGDFPGFYGAAVIVDQHDPRQLYNLKLQWQVQHDTWPSLGRTALFFPYPPFFAFALRPLAWVSPEAARFLFSAFMLALLGTLPFVAGRFVPLFQELPLFAGGALMLSVAFGMPAYIGQNTSLSLLLYLGGAALMVKRMPGREFAAGLLLSMWLYKPQLGVPALILFGVLGGVRFFQGAALGAAVLYLMGVAVGGVLWPLWYLDALRFFGNDNTGRMSDLMISLYGLRLQLSQILGLKARGFLLMVPELVISLAVVWTAVRVLWRGRTEERCRVFGLALIGSATVLLGAQVIFYDFAIGFAGLLALMRLRNSKDLLKIVLLLIGASLVVWCHRTFPVNLLTLSSALLFPYMVALGKREFGG